jgi:hypothetical protein
LVHAASEKVAKMIVLPEHESTWQLPAPEAVHTALVEQSVPEMVAAAEPVQVGV